MDDPGYEEEDLLMRDVASIEREQPKWLEQELRRSKATRGRKWLVVTLVREPALHRAALRELLD